MALPTHPIESWIEEFEKYPLENPIIGSVYGFKPEDYSILIGMVDKYVDAWELNVSCPNKEKGEESLMDTMTSKVDVIVKPLRSVTQKPIIVKLSPNEDYVSLAELVKDHVDYIGCGNTVGPGLVIDIYSRRPVLAGIKGGMSGPAIMPRNVAMVHEVYQVIKDTDVGIVAYGGIENWEDIIEYTIAGASVYGLGTCLLKEEFGQILGRSTNEIVKLTKDICGEVNKFLEQQNTTLDDLRGSLIL
jgi:dihydroorotate dehydrogenase (NAD+) catalytic subunit